MIVIDTSAAIAALVQAPRNDALLARLAQGRELHAPHLIDVEFIHALRRIVRLRKLSGDRAVVVRTDFEDLSIVRYPHGPLLDRMWALRDSLSAYDAAFVALAEALDVPLITVDGGLARARGHQANIELF
ncbi:MAG: type II toxin-antitoxin system VapC family toxin [Actinomycetota bacterium]